ncbi:MAG: hypothetical protein U0975_16330 [Erythrobacter sp.]|nr:hypothetical protein [Erythrobacter sp.]MDZ4274229.1 hypothetical protein [Erythrobacter sp.]
MTMKTVKFLMPYTVGALYNEGEVAGFDEAITKDLIERGIAEPVKATKSDGKDDAAAKKAADEAAKKAAEEAAKAAKDDAAS